MTRKRTGLVAGLAAVAATLAVVLSGSPATCTVGSTAKMAVALGGCGTDGSARGPLTTKGHVVQQDPKIVLVFWGPSWSTSPFERKVITAEQDMVRQLAGSGYGAILGQYGVHNDIKLLATVTDHQAPPAHALTHGDFYHEVLRAQSLSGQPNSNDVQWLIFPPGSENPKNFANECGEHNYFKHQGHYYFWSVTDPFDNPQYHQKRDSCLAYDGGGTSLVDAETSTTAHEIYETATDAIYDHGAGWRSPHTPASWNEGADLCYGQGVRLPGTPAAPGAVVQAFWSNASEGPNHDRGCVQSAAGGIPQCVGGNDGGPCGLDFVPDKLSSSRRPLPPVPSIQKIGDPPHH